MASNIETFKIEGLKELYDKLNTMDEQMSKKIAKKAASAGARIVRDAARVKAPVDTGNLKKAIVFKFNRKSTLTAGYNVAVRVGKTDDVRRAKAGDRAAIGKDAWYARLLEYGTVKMSPRPFMGPALSSNINKINQVMKDKLTEEIDKEFKK